MHHPEIIKVSASCYEVHVITDIIRFKREEEAAPGTSGTLTL
jgi:hypothetical protein